MAERKVQPITLRRPWWPYAATIWVEKHLPSAAHALEFGGGGSTLWLMDHGATVTVVEHEPGWARELAAMGVKVALVTPTSDGEVRSGVEPGYFDSYVAVAEDFADGSLDLVIVDGRARVDCVRRAMAKVRPGGVLLLDDTDRQRYAPALKLLAGWRRHVFCGLKPGALPLDIARPAETSVWQRPADSKAS
jgi:hypothetical protein